MTLEDQHKDRDNQQLANANERELFSWKAPARPFKRRDREYWVSILAIAGVIGLIILIIEGVMPVILIVALVFFHTFVNMAMTVGVMPITGLPLPLLSYGGTFMVTIMSALGIIQSVHIRSRHVAVIYEQGRLWKTAPGI